MNRRIFSVAFLTAALAACATGPEISSDMTAGADFSNYRTYEWVEIQPGPGMNPVAIDRMRQGIEAAMVAKGYSRAKPGDLTLIMTVAGKERVDVRQWGPYGHGVDTYRYTQGTLSLDAFDTNTKRPVWHGQASQNVDPGRTDNAVIDAAVAGVMARFPARQ